MEIYVGRQPIFDRKLNVIGYELLYRRSMNNFYEGKDDNQATAELISNAFLAMQFKELTGGTKAFINFSEDMLINEIPLLLPKETVVVEILERVKVTEEILEACKDLKRNGYMIALDDFVFHESYLPLIELADIIKIEFPNITTKVQRQLIKQYKHNTKFLAERIETRDEFQAALAMGYDYFQGYFFSKPVIIKGKEIDELNANLVRILNDLNEQEPDFQRISESFKRDLGISYKLLRLANSAFYESRHKITSIKLALTRLGINETKKWVYIMMLKEIQNIENSELIKSCLIRGRFMELISLELRLKNKQVEYFMTGMFSSIDVLLNRSMDEILSELPLNIDVQDALLGSNNNSIRSILDLILNYELSDWNKFEDSFPGSSIPQERFMELYIESLNWILELDY